MRDYSWVPDLIRLPWRAYATGPAAYDCYGLVWTVLRDQYGVDVDRHLEIESGNHRAMHRVILREQAAGRWQRLDRPVDGCVVLLSTGEKFHHIGLWLDVNGGRVLHSRQGRGVALDSMQQLASLSFRKFEYWQAIE